MDSSHPPPSLYFFALVPIPKVTKGRNGTNLQRYLYLSPTNKQVVWATKSTPKGTLSKKGLTLDAITELHSEDGGIRVEAVSALPIRLFGLGSGSFLRLSRSRFGVKVRAPFSYPVKRLSFHEI